MNTTVLTNNLKRTFYRAGFKIKKHSPEILMVAGVAGVVTSAVMACKATTKLSDIMDRAKADIDVIHDAMENPENLPEPYTPEDGKKDLALVYANTGVELIKLYGPSVALGGLSIASIFASNNIMRKRNVALAAAYTAVDTGFKVYRNRVVERFGDELDKELRYDIKAKEVKETVVDDEGKKKTVKKTIQVVDPHDLSMYARFFDAGNPGWDENPEFTMMYLKQQERYANHRLEKQGHLYLNEVYDMLGYPRTKYGQVVGWVYDSKHTKDSFVDFGIYNAKVNKAFTEGQETVAILDFNVQGNILDLY